MSDIFNKLLKLRDSRSKVSVYLQEKLTCFYGTIEEVGTDYFLLKGPHDIIPKLIPVRSILFIKED